MSAGWDVAGGGMPLDAMLDQAVQRAYHELAMLKDLLPSKPSAERQRAILVRAPPSVASSRPH